MLILHPTLEGNTVSPKDKAEDGLPKKHPEQTVNDIRNRYQGIGNPNVLNQK